ncbi:MAG: hypothetical protein JEZ11_12670 [Desulfobacterales bacterium]|nr:hypothetical protein [Desulfobacterales bacterium]
MESVIDLTIQGNLEEYAREKRLSPDMIESWVSAGMLSPQETTGAQKLLKMLRTKSPYSRVR